MHLDKAITRLAGILGGWFGSQTSTPGRPSTHRHRQPADWRPWIVAAFVAALPSLHGAVVSTNRAAVTAIQSAGATSLFEPDLAAVRSMIDRGLVQFTGRPNITAAWQSVVPSNEVVALKICSAPGPLCGTRPAVVEAVVSSLIAAGHPPSRIVIWDKRSYDLRAMGWNSLAQRLGVRCISSMEAGWSADHYLENALLGRPLYGELEFDLKREGIGRRSHLTKLLTREAPRIISIAPVLNHNQAGVNGHLLGLGFGAFDNTLRFEGNNNVIAESIPDLLLKAQAEIVDRLALCIGDALICQYRGEDRTLLHYAVALNELRFSKDPVALDVLAIADIENARKTNPTDGEKPVKTELYNNAELVELGVADPKRIDVTRVP